MRGNSRPRRPRERGYNYPHLIDQGLRSRGCHSQEGTEQKQKSSLQPPTPNPLETISMDHLCWFPLQPYFSTCWLISKPFHLSLSRKQQWHSLWARCLGFLLQMGLKKSCRDWEKEFLKQFGGRGGACIWVGSACSSTVPARLLPTTPSHVVPAHGFRSYKRSWKFEF